MSLAQERDVDMVLLAGDLFHENVPSRKSMYNVMRSLRMNCLGAKPCELEMLSDGSEHFDPAFDHVNYEDRDINISIPVFSIHGNHDDPSGEGHFAALDLLTVSGLINYFGRTPESDNIVIKPVLLQKGRTKLALYGEVLPSKSTDGDWFHMICVHQNHHAHTETSYLPENFLPEFLDLVIWGHEHECDIQPHMNPEMNFRVMQPGSSVATSLVPGEAVPKHVALVSITGKEFKSEPIRLKTVRPFVYKDLVLSKDREAVRIAKKDNHRTELTRHLMKVVDELIGKAKQEWQEAQEENHNPDDEEELECPLPLVRLRIDTTPADGIAKFDIENPQRFSNRFIDKVANTNDVVQFQSKKKTGMNRVTGDVEADRKIMARFEGLEGIKVEAGREFLEAQSLTILPQNYFGDAVTQYVDKDDKHAMEIFVNDSLANQIKHLVKLQNDEDDEDDEREDLGAEIDRFRTQLEEEFAKGNLKAFRGKIRYKPKPDNWDSDLEGSWEDQPGALQRADSDFEEDEDENEISTPAPRGSTRGRGRGRVVRASATAAKSNRKTAYSNSTTTTTKSRGRKKAIEEEEEDEDNEDEDVVMLDDDEDDAESDSQAIFFQDTRKSDGTGQSKKNLNPPDFQQDFSSNNSSTKTRKPPNRASAVRASKPKQSTLSFTASQRSILGMSSRNGDQNLSDDIEDDDNDDDAFEPMTKTRAKR